MERYHTENDPLCYPDTQILINKAGIKNQDKLEQYEQLMFLTRSEEDLPDGNLDYQHYKFIHHHFFQDVYEWAGQSRQIRTGKGGNWFCYPEYIDQNMERIFSELENENHLSSIQHIRTFAEKASHYIAEINAIHPFREGNGRCQLTLLSLLFGIAGFEFNEELIEPTKFMNAMITSFHGDNTELEKSIITIAN